MMEEESRRWVLQLQEDDARRRMRGEEEQEDGVLQPLPHLFSELQIQKHLPVRKLSLHLHLFAASELHSLPWFCSFPTTPSKQIPPMQTQNKKKNTKITQRFFHVQNYWNSLQ
jgi:hypothetical protein